MKNLVKIVARKTAKPTRREWNCSSGALFQRCYFPARYVPLETPHGDETVVGKASRCSHPGLVGNRSHVTVCE